MKERRIKVAQKHAGDITSGAVTPYEGSRQVTRLTLQPAQVIGTGTNTEAAIPRILMDDLLLSDALRNLARQAGIPIPPDDFDAIKARGLEKRISLDWQNVASRQALTALLDNFNLILIEDRENSSARIALRTTR